MAGEAPPPGGGELPSAALAAFASSATGIVIPPPAQSCRRQLDAPRQLEAPDKSATELFRGNQVPTKKGRRYAVCDSSNELKFCAQTRRSKGEAGSGKYGCGCDCERCKWRVAHLAELNNDIMRAPETAYIFAAFLAAQPLPKNCAITAHDIPQTKALARVAAASTTQEERFLRYLAMQQPHKPVLGRSEYTREELWREFDGRWERDEDRNQRKKDVGWRQQYEPHTVHIKSEDDLGQRMGKLMSSLAHEAPGALSKRRDRKRGVRVWVLDHAKLREYFEQHEDDDSSDEEPASGSGEAFPSDWGDLEAVARDFVRKHLAEASREEAPTAESGV
jgi:hypothetical protein